MPPVETRIVTVGHLLGLAERRAAACRQILGREARMRALLVREPAGQPHPVVVEVPFDPVSQRGRRSDIADDPPDVRRADAVDAAGDQDPAHLGEGGVGIAEMLQGVERIDQVEAVVLEAHRLRVHYAKIGGRGRFGVETRAQIDPRRRRAEALAQQHGLAAGAAADHQDAARAASRRLLDEVPQRLGLAVGACGLGRTAVRLDDMIHDALRRGLRGVRRRRSQARSPAVRRPPSGAAAAGPG